MWVIELLHHYLLSILQEYCCFPELCSWGCSMQIFSGPGNPSDDVTQTFGRHFPTFLHLASAWGYCYNWLVFYWYSLFYISTTTHTHIYYNKMPETVFFWLQLLLPWIFVQPYFLEHTSYGFDCECLHHQLNHLIWYDQGMYCKLLDIF